ncbi:MAG TPA: tripartite tricarboxylate transporter substrate-binding protein, partial [Casimicrobiaceae bacterium]|nr:tripartite tricarboxylate transporter substrate-binding protein [Casimicrobiaceae bacterium]
MKSIIRTFSRALTFIVIASLSLPIGALAQSTYPTHPAKIIVPFPPGGPADALARLAGDKLTQALGQPFVVENRPGAGGNIGMELGAKAAPDGYTLTLAPVGNLTIAPALYSKLPYDPAKDYAPITVLAAVPNVLIVHPSVPARTLAELIALAKSKPGTLNYASPGNGSGPHLAGELFKSTAGIDIVHVPYNGVAPAMNAVLGGQVQMFFAQ